MADPGEKSPSSATSRLSTSSSDPPSKSTFSDALYLQFLLLWREGYLNAFNPHQIFDDTYTANRFGGGQGGVVACSGGIREGGGHLASRNPEARGWFHRLCCLEVIGYYIFVAFVLSSQILIGARWSQR